jgi:peptidyl-prolyl cis-trans isomerase D
MMKLLRSQSQTVLAILLGVIALGFLFYGSSGTLLTSAGGHVTSDYGRIDGQDLSARQLTEAIRTTRASFLLMGRSQQLNQPNAREMVAEEAWRQLLLQREADRLHIEITDQQLIDYIHGLSVFQKDGVYSPDEYQKQMSEIENRFHISPDLFETVMRNNLRADAASAALFSTIRTSAKDVAAQYEKYYGPAIVSLVSFDPKAFVGTVAVKPEEIEAEYKAHGDNPDYRTEEKRRVDYVLFPLTPEQAKLPDAEKKAALEALGEKALDFALAFQPNPSANGTTPPPPDFVAEAKKRGLNPVTTDFFTVGTTPANLPPSPTFNNSAFALAKDDPISKVIEMGNGVAVLHLAEIQPSALRPLDEVKAVIEKQLLANKASQAAASAAQDFQTAAAKAADFKATAETLKLKVETLPAFVPVKAPQTDPRLQTVAYVVVGLTPGQLSPPVPVQSDNTTLVLHLDRRDPADPAGLADFEGRYRQSQDQQLRALAYVDWANWYSKKSGTHKPPYLDDFGAVE